MAQKILVITPRFPLPDAGACEQDRLEGLKQLKRLGFDVRVLAKVFQFQDREAIARFSREFRIRIDCVGYEHEKPRSAVRKSLFYLKRLLIPVYWDGAAYEYSHASIRGPLRALLCEWRPDVVMADYTYLWPLYGIIRKARIPIVTRSINFEPMHFLQEDGYSAWNIAKALPKFLSELLVIGMSDWIFAITPKEERTYRRWGARRISTLPLRGLPKIMASGREIAEKQTLHVFFAGSTYTVSHNREALEFIIREIAPELERRAPGIFIIHVTGAKMPVEIQKEIHPPVEHRGFVEDWNAFLEQMDIAIVPSLFGAGMQQKIFEPLSRGIPTIASARGLADYPFRHGEHLWAAHAMNDFIEGLLALRDVRLRRYFSQNALRVSREIFSRSALDAIIRNVAPFHHVRH